MMFHPVTIYEIAVQHLLMGCCRGEDSRLFVNRRNSRPIWGEGACVFGEGGSCCVFMLDVFFQCVLGTAHLQAVSLPGKTKKTVQRLKKIVLVELFLTHFQAVNICLDRCLAPQENIQLCIDAIVAEV